MMVETLLIGGLVGIAVAMATSLIALKIQYRALDRTQAQQQAWERAQHVHQQQWQAQQEKLIAECEQRLSTLVQQLQTEWQIWMEKEASRAERVAGEYASALMRAYKEHEVARMPRVDWIPASSGEKSQAQQGFAHWQAAKLQEADLSHRDLSQRYLGRANLREAYLVNTNLYMSNLTGACLAGANLTAANLIGANLTGADLKEATLTGANVLVADLNNAVLIGANLIGVRNLTLEQVHAALYDSTTQFDPEIDATLSSLDTHITTPSSLSSSTHKQPSMPNSEVVTNPVLSSNVESEASPPPFFPDTTSLTQQKTEETSTASSPQPSGDSPDTLMEPGLPADRPENIHTEEPDTNLPRRRGNGRKRAKVN